MPDVDDGSIPNECRLLRRIHPDQVVKDENSGSWRPSSGAFRHLELSVDAESVLIDLGLDWKFCLSNYIGYSLAAFSAGRAREKALPVIPKPSPENQAHTEVHGKKTGAVTKYLRSVCVWVHPA
jgi:hypothetical protein